MHLIQDLRYALRLLRRTPGFTAVAVLVLALGIGANTAAFSLVNALLLQPRPGRIDRMVGVFNRDRLKPDAYRDFSYPAYEDLRARGDVFESLMAHTFAMVGVREGDLTRRSFVTLVSANYFSTLGVRLAAGRPFTLEEERPGARAPVAVASYAAWRRAGFAPSFIWMRRPSGSPSANMRRASATSTTAGIGLPPPALPKDTIDAKAARSTPGTPGIRSRIPRYSARCEHGRLRRNTDDEARSVRVGAVGTCLRALRITVPREYEPARPHRSNGRRDSDARGDSA